MPKYLLPLSLWSEENKEAKVKVTPLRMNHTRKYTFKKFYLHSHLAPF